MTDKEYMQIAINISRKGKFPFGAIVVNPQGTIIGRSDSKDIVNNSIYNHAEFNAISDATKNGDLIGQLKGCIIYSSCEPCPMCMGAILSERIEKLVYGATLEDSSKLYDEVLISCEDIANKTKNRKIEIKNIMRKEAAEVFKELRK